MRRVYHEIFHLGSQEIFWRAYYDFIFLTGRLHTLFVVARAWIASACFRTRCARPKPVHRRAAATTWMNQTASKKRTAELEEQKGGWNDPGNDSHFRTYRFFSGPTHSSPVPRQALAATLKKTRRTLTPRQRTRSARGMTPTKYRDRFSFDLARARSREPSIELEIIGSLAII